ncbi:hypothetical protein [Serratia silvae]|uniref:Uncharacterized protein n=1 Tax=Serratia silvae TaxID=2824122 RepID=A0ABT0KG80_9GAMM|nr:hypothetical protein [Serratia silvae]MCL1031045.1 hypothetical protein [Serratia silvae]
MKIMLIFIIAVLAVVFYFGWLLTMPKVTYTEKDFFKYYLLTHKEVRDAPRLSKNYYFEYGPSDITEPNRSSMYVCGLSNVDEGYQRLVLYVNETGIPFEPQYKFGEPLPKNGDEYFTLEKRYFGSSEPCLMLTLTECDD